MRIVSTGWWNAGEGNKRSVVGRLPVLITIVLTLFFLALHVFRKGSYVAFCQVGADATSHSHQFNIVDVEENLWTLDQTDTQLILYTRIRHLTPPSKLPYNLEVSGNHIDEFSSWVANIFKNKTNGRFIEAGANDGEKGSHTLYLEKELGWSGLLIECNPKLIPSLKSHHRKAWIADVCLSTSATPGVVNFSNPTNWSYSGTLKKPWNLSVAGKWEIFEVQTIPLYTVLAALGWTDVDYFSFDIEGIELSVLKSFPFKLVTFKLLVIEVYFYSEAERTELHELLTTHGYILVKIGVWDRYYMHESFNATM